ncbi:MAG TPA: hypothetical protein PJ991_10505 [Kiritimatiellia bacterium]|nr:hypothetical protein [Kiritimatiellia bacterium]
MPSSPGLFKKYANALRVEAQTNAGFFTAAQARAAGYADSVHGYHVSKGEWIKVQRGIYRLADFPEPEWPELIVYSLWSRDREGLPQGVFTHDTARQIHGLERRASDPVHMTVPRSFRKNAETPGGLILHKEDLADTSWEQRNGFRVLRAELCNQRTPASRHPYDSIIVKGED